MKSWSFERDCPFCTRSASNFCRNPLNFLAHAMWMKWWYHANFQPFQSSILGSYSSKIISKCMKNNKWSQKGLKNDDVALNVEFWTQNVRSSNKFKKMKSLCNRRVSVWNPDTLKEIGRFVHEVHPVYAVTLSTFLHMLCGWNDDIMPNFQPFQSSFEMLFNFRVL